MKKLLLLSVAAASLIAMEFQFGKGTFEMKGGYAGLTSSIDTDITTFSLFEQHKNIFDSKWFYGFDITWNESDDLNQLQEDISSLSRSTSLSDLTNTSSSTTNDSSSITTLPSLATKYKFQGIDLNIILGRDIIHKSDEDFVGVGLLLGASFPWIDSDSNSDTASTIQEDLKNTKTEIITYKIGPTLSARKSFNKYLMIYGNLSYAYQTANIKNTKLDIDQNTDGNYFNYGFGLRFQPFSTEKKVWFITLKPKLYFTIGYKYNKWVVKDISINTAGIEYSQKTDLTMTSTTTYAGIGYSF